MIQYRDEFADGRALIQMITGNIVQEVSVSVIPARRYECAQRLFLAALGFAKMLCDVPVQPLPDKQDIVFIFEA